MTDRKKKIPRRDNEDNQYHQEGQPPYKIMDEDIPRHHYPEYMDGYQENIPENYHYRRYNYGFEQRPYRQDLERFQSPYPEYYNPPPYRKGGMVSAPPESKESSSSDSDTDTKKRKTGRKKINMAYIEGKNKRSVTFSKRKKGIMKKAYELNVLTGTQILLLVASESGHVYTFATSKLRPIISKHENLIQQCLNAPNTPETNNYDIKNEDVPYEKEDYYKDNYYNQGYDYYNGFEGKN
ncbi:MADS box-containing transcription factor [Hamiltosporidium tvaerminnensis]|uniref:MADS box-containing transcription factor n=2 Tax=Hamiltosporidium TaxID=1176354 RepID=A0A4Q9KYJ3_9MICR|nr:transcription factor of the MADS box [Hamiltosporidium tvaerminnensis]TBT97925.1 MADS box-containing transcription factor [Hamiltosporidium tvaerminnensis]TBU00063.1 MADS box-containing transcription factor [Hamiltosporidium magnivora]TBU06973.1 MADS box-containing transcription factor [Hamiltosporidium magnivora]TBU20272.1 MADS box-containing transcription factor [Hamiltosporidium tvaerminnensis]